MAVDDVPKDDVIVCPVVVSDKEIVSVDEASQGIEFVNREGVEFSGIVVKEQRIEEVGKDLEVKYAAPTAESVVGRLLVALLRGERFWGRLRSLKGT